MIPLPHLPAGVLQVVGALLDALAVQVKYKKKNETDEAQDYTQEDVRGLQSEVSPCPALMAPQS